MEFVVISIVSFIFAIGIIVGVHEYGHFITARLLKVKVIEYSIGFGPKILSWKSKKTDIVYKISLLPLGGYVRMLQSNEINEFSNYDISDLRLCYDKVPLWKRALIVLNGPMANLVLSVFLFSIIAMNGITINSAVVGDVNGWAEEYGIKSHDKIIKVADTSVEGWNDFAVNIATKTGQNNVSITVLRNKEEVTLLSDMSELKIERKDKNIVDKMGLIPIQINIPSAISFIQDNSPADTAGIMVNDEIKTMDGKNVSKWSDLAEYVFSNPGKESDVVLLRGQKEISLNITFSGNPNKSVSNSNHGKIGLSPKIPDYNSDWQSVKEFGIIGSIGYGFSKSYESFVLTGKFLIKMIKSEISLDTLSGPVGISKATGNSAEAGIFPFLSVVAFISINVMLMNLLPIPGLDGGHLAMFSIESIFGPVPEKIQSSLGYLGAAFLIALMTYAIGLDFIDLFVTIFN